MWGYANVVRYGAGHLSDNGAIVLVSGIPARRPKPGQVAIGAVGGAVENFARTVAREIAPKRLNVVAPGQIDTPMVGLQGMTGRHFTRTPRPDIRYRAPAPPTSARRPSCSASKTTS